MNRKYVCLTLRQVWNRSYFSGKNFFFIMSCEVKNKKNKIKSLKKY